MCVSRKLKSCLLAMAGCVLLPGAAGADIHTLVDERTLHLFAEEVSGESAKRELEAISLHHRMRASRAFRKAADHIRDSLKAAGFDNAEVLEFPADGRTMFGTQKSRLEWEVAFAELWELEKGPEGSWRRARRLGDWHAMPLSLAQDSSSGRVTAGLVDAGAGTEESDYAGKEVKGKLVLTSSQPGAVADLAVGKNGAAGIISYAPNQKSAWWKDDDRLVRWGHLSSFTDIKTFAFMISLGEARRLQERMAAGEELRFDARVEATHQRGRYALTTTTIPGTDPAMGREEVVFSCHLDHPRPGANDNASGCAAIYEAARATKKLIDEGRLPRPKRTLRFIWPAEIEGTLIYLTSDARRASRIKANIHLDMVGGGPQTKAIFRVSGGPMSLPHFISDFGHELGRFVNVQTEIHASGGNADLPLIAPEGGQEAQLALMEGISLGSDHQVFNEGSWRIPGIYLHDWPDRYIHTNFDSTGIIDPTKLKRAAFIGAVTGWFLANLDGDDVPGILALLREGALRRAGDLADRVTHMGAGDTAAVTRVHWQVERGKIRSIKSFAELPGDAEQAAYAFLDSLAGLVRVPDAETASASDRGATVYARNEGIKGPMSAFGYSYLTDKLGKEREDKLGLLRFKAKSFTGAEVSGGEMAYEALNLVDGKRSVAEIRDWLTAEFAPVPVDLVAEYLEALRSIGVIRVTTEVSAKN